MLEDVEQYLRKALKLNDGLLAIVIADRDGVPLIKISDDDHLDLAMRPSFLTPFSLATDHAGKLGIGQNNAIISMYTNYQVIQLNHSPLVVTFFGTNDANTGLLLDLGESMKPLVSQLSPMVDV